MFGAESTRALLCSDSAWICACTLRPLLPFSTKEAAVAPAALAGSRVSAFKFDALPTRPPLAPVSKATCPFAAVPR